MKRTKLLIGRLFGLILFGCFIGCSQSISLPEDIESDSYRAVRITTRSTADIAYPLTVYAFSSTGALAQKISIESSDEELELSLLKGEYTLVAMAGTEGLTSADNPTKTADIGIPANGIITSAVQMGRADITVGGGNEQTVTLAMAYQVAQLDVTLQDIPTEVTAMYLTLSSLYVKENFQGDLSNPQSITVALEKESEGVWKSSTLYTLPGSSTQLTLSISMESATGTDTYGYTHTSNFVAGIPYTLSGSYNGYFNISGIVTSEGWGAPENISFTFGGEANGGNITPDNNNDDKEDDDKEGDDEDKNKEEEIYTVAAIPQVQSIWNGHFVASVTSTDSKNATLMLMSLEEWETTGSEAAATISSQIASYSEDGISRWSVPTATELANIIATLGLSDQIDKTNSLLHNNQGIKLTGSKYYLCDEGAKYLKMGNSQAAKSIESSGSYRLRFVKHINVQVQ